MSQYQRIQLCLEAVQSKKTEIGLVNPTGQLIALTNLLMELDALERCLQIEIEMLLMQQERSVA